MEDEMKDEMSDLYCIYNSDLDCYLSRGDTIGTYRWYSNFTGDVILFLEDTGLPDGVLLFIQMCALEDGIAESKYMLRLNYVSGNTRTPDTLPDFRVVYPFRYHNVWGSDSDL